ncbi:hypothetical protein AB0435_23465, partial [Streptomyces sp. NPDC051173]
FAGNDEGQIIVVDDAGRTVVPAHEAGIKRLVARGRETSARPTPPATPSAPERPSSPEQQQPSS